MTKYITIIFALAFIACNMKSTNDSGNNESANGFKLIWQDEFDYTGLPDSAKWEYDTEGNEAGWGNNESQFYTSANLENARVEDGKLKITAQHQSIGGKDFTSARLISKAEWQYGRIEVSAKVPDGRGSWSAIWMMPGGWRFSHGNWPDVGEIDILEHVGHETGVIHASAHSKDYQWQKGTQKTGITNVPAASEKFHVYALEWNQDVMKVSVDDSLFFVYQNEGSGESRWPFDKPFSLIMNVAVGGAWGIVQGIDTAAFPQTMEIDYVRVYQKED
jgi:beta-glucanase (GH16 family)